MKWKLPTALILVLISALVYSWSKTIISSERTVENRLNFQKQQSYSPSVLMILSSAHLLEGNKESFPTGYWLEEFVVPYRIFTQNGFKVVVATPDGALPQADPFSYALDEQGKPLYWESKEALDQALALNASAIREDKIKPLAEFNTNGLDDFDAVFFPGGYAPIEDLAFDAQVAQTLGYFHQAQKPTALLCHGPAALLSTLNAGDFLYKGYRTTAFSNSEERSGELYQNLGGFKAFEKTYGGLLETALESAGMIYQKGTDWTPHIVIDRELFTGQNPASSALLAQAVVDRMNSK